MKTFMARLRSAPRFFVQSWRSAFEPIPGAADEAAADKALVKRILMRFSHGNVSLKMGRLLTSEMIDARWKRMQRYSFCD